MDICTCRALIRGLNCAKGIVKQLSAWDPNHKWVTLECLPTCMGVLVSAVIGQCGVKTVQYVGCDLDGMIQDNFTQFVATDRSIRIEDPKFAPRQGQI